MPRARNPSISILQRNSVCAAKFSWVVSWNDEISKPTAARSSIVSASVARKLSSGTAAQGSGKSGLTVWAGIVVKEHQPAAWFEDAKCLPEKSSLIGDAHQDTMGVGSVEGCVRQRQRCRAAGENPDLISHAARRV